MIQQKEIKLSKNKLVQIIVNFKTILQENRLKLIEIECDEDIDQDDVFEFMDEIDHLNDILNEIQKRNNLTLI